MKIEGCFLGLGELSLGFHMAYGEDEYGQFHMLEIGLLIFSITFYKYLTNTE